MATQTIIKLDTICKSFKKTDHPDLLVLDHVNLTLRSGEIVALLGRSGSGKSTLLRIIAGLIPPTSGTVFYRDKPIIGPAHGIAMVFQHFALLPWLTVLQNVELGLEALHIPKSERRNRALQAIDTIGLDGFESAFPRELSGGMKQRVGFARALVVNPDILLMDEPFSALDVLTADNLKGDLLDLWQAKKTNINSLLFVTHNIEEAALLADRIIIFHNEPGNTHTELEVDMPHPRNDQDLLFRKLVDSIYTLMTTSTSDTGTISPAMARQKTTTFGHRLPSADISGLTGLLETLSESGHHGRMDLPELANYLSLDVDDLFPLTEALELLRFAHVKEGDIELSMAGHLFASADILERKKIFASHLLKYIPLAKQIRRILDERPEHTAPKQRFLNELEDYLSEQEAERVLNVAIEWGRYAEIFAYNHNTEMLSLENP